MFIDPLDVGGGMGIVIDPPELGGGMGMSIDPPEVCGGMAPGCIEWPIGMVIASPVRWWCEGAIDFEAALLCDLVAAFFFGAAFFLDGVFAAGF